MSHAREERRLQVGVDVNVVFVLWCDGWLRIGSGLGLVLPWGCEGWSGMGDCGGRGVGGVSSARLHARPRLRQVIWCDDEDLAPRAGDCVFHHLSDAAECLRFGLRAGAMVSTIGRIRDPAPPRFGRESDYGYNSG